jgi:methionyl-tRNA formyltransferase
VERVTPTGEVLRIVFMGTPEIAVPSLEALVSAGHDVVAAVTQPDRPAGRGRAPVAPAVKIAAIGLGLTVLQPERLRGADIIAELRALRADAIVVAAFGQILLPTVLRMTRLGCLNVHPSMLPALRGASPINWAILQGLTSTGVTIMLLDEGMDTGPILAQVEEPVDARDDAMTLGTRLGMAGAALLIPTLAAWAAGAIAPRAQDPERANYSRILTRADGIVDWSLSVAEIDRRIRAFVPWPGVATQWAGRQIKLTQALPTDDRSDVAPGTVLGLGPIRGRLTPDGDEVSVPALRVSTGDGILAVTQLQMEGRRATSAAEFARGYPAIVGARLDSPAAQP